MIKIMIIIFLNKLTFCANYNLYANEIVTIHTIVFYRVYQVDKNSDLPVQFRSQFSRITNILAVHQPKPETTVS